jgi:hypothetical protein
MRTRASIFIVKGIDSDSHTQIRNEGHCAMFFDGSSSSRKEVNLGGKRKGLAANAKDKASFVEQVANDSTSSPLYSPQSPLLHPSSSPRSLPSALSAKLCDAAKSGCITGILSLVITSIP